MQQARKGTSGSRMRVNQMYLDLALHNTILAPSCPATNKSGQTPSTSVSVELNLAGEIMNMRKRKNRIMMDMRQPGLESVKHCVNRWLRTFRSFKIL